MFRESISKKIIFLKKYWGKYLKIKYNLRLQLGENFICGWSKSQADMQFKYNKFMHVYFPSYMFIRKRACILFILISATAINFRAWLLVYGLAARIKVKDYQPVLATDYECYAINMPPSISNFQQNKIRTRN